jgi:ribosomal protein L7/L12
MAGEYSTEALDRHFQAIGKRLDHIEEQLKRIANAGGVDYATYAETNEVPDEVVQLAQAGDRLAAIKRFRELTGANFGQAAEIVDGL